MLGDIKLTCQFLFVYDKIRVSEEKFHAF